MVARTGDARARRFDPAASLTDFEKYGLKIEGGTTIKDVVPWKSFDKAEIMSEVEALGFMSDFHPFQKQIEAYQGEEILVVADPEQVYGDSCGA